MTCYICKIYKTEDLVLYYNTIDRKFVSNKAKGTAFNDLGKALLTRKNHKILPLETDRYSIIIATENQISYHSNRG